MKAKIQCNDAINQTPNLLNRIRRLMNQDRQV